MVARDGRRGSLETLRARARALAVVYLGARRLRAARAVKPDREVVFLAVGLSTTTPAPAHGGGACWRPRCGRSAHFSNPCPGTSCHPGAMEAAARRRRRARGCGAFNLPRPRQRRHRRRRLTRPSPPLPQGPGVVAGLRASRACFEAIRRLLVRSARASPASRTPNGAVVTDARQRARAARWSTRSRALRNRGSGAPWGPSPRSGLDPPAKPIARFDARARFGGAEGPDEQPAGCLWRPGDSRARRPQDTLAVFPPRRRHTFGQRHGEVAMYAPG